MFPYLRKYTQFKDDIFLLGGVSLPSTPPKKRTSSSFTPLLAFLKPKMNSFSFSAFSKLLSSRQLSRTCTNCRSQLSRTRPSPFWPQRQYATAGNGWSRAGGDQTKPPRRLLLFASTGAAVGTGTMLAFADDVKGAYEAAERTGRVIAVLGLCVNEYVLPKLLLSLWPVANFITIATERH